MNNEYYLVLKSRREYLKNAIINFGSMIILSDKNRDTIVNALRNELHLIDMELDDIGV
jgi:hypothetical protein